MADFNSFEKKIATEVAKPFSKALEAAMCQSNPLQSAFETSRIGALRKAVNEATLQSETMNIAKGIPTNEMQIALKKIGSISPNLTRTPLGALSVSETENSGEDFPYTSAQSNLRKQGTAPFLSNNTKKIQSITDIGIAVRNARKAKNLTQQNFADLAGVGRRFLSELEAGKPTLEIGKVLQVTTAAGLRLTIVNNSDE